MQTEKLILLKEKSSVLPLPVDISDKKIYVLTGIFLKKKKFPELLFDHIYLKVYFIFASNFVQMVKKKAQLTKIEAQLLASKKSS